MVRESVLTGQIKCCSMAKMTFYKEPDTLVMLKHVHHGEPLIFQLKLLNLRTG